MARLAILATLLASIGCKSSSHKSDAPTKIGLLDYVYVVGAGPGINGQPPPAAQLYALALGADGTLTSLGTYSALGGVAGLLVNNTPGQDVIGHLYMGASGGFKVMEIEKDGSLVDTGLITGVFGQVAFLPAGGTYEGYAYVFVTASDGTQTINEFGVNADGTFQSIGALAAGNNVTALESFRNPVATSHLTNATGSTLGALYAPSVASVGEWTIALDGSLTTLPTIGVPTADANTGCNLLYLQTSTVAIGETDIVGSGVNLFVLQDIGNIADGCGSEHAGVVVFSINSATGALTLDNTIQLPTTNDASAPQQLASAGPSLAFASARGTTRHDGMCGGGSGCGTMFKTLNADDTQFVAAVTDSDPIGSLAVDTYTEPLTTTCVACNTCAMLAKDGSLPQWTVALGADPTGSWLLVGDPGIGAANATATTGPNYCEPQVTSISKPAVLHTVSVDGSFTDGFDYTLGDGQFAMQINFLDYYQLVNGHGGN